MIVQVNKVLYLQFFPKVDGLILSPQGYPSYPEGSLQPPSQQSRQRHSSRSPHTGTVPFPEPQRGAGSASHPQAYFPPSQTTQNLTVPGPAHYQHERRSSHGHSPARSSFDSQRLYPAGAGSDTGGNTFYSQQPGVQSHHGGGYNATAAQTQDWNTAVHEGSQGHGPWPIAPGVPPVGGHSKPTFDLVPFFFQIFIRSHLGQSRTQVENDAVYNEGHDSRPKAPPSRPVNTSSN